MFAVISVTIYDGRGEDIADLSSRVCNSVANLSEKVCHGQGSVTMVSVMVSDAS